MAATQVLNPSTLFAADGLVVVITGGGTGIGFDMAQAAFRTGAAKVYILGRRMEVLTQAAKSLDETLTKVVPLECDVTSMDTVIAAAAHIEQQTGYIDVLVNNAGYNDGIVDITHAETVLELQTDLLKAHSETLKVLNTNAVSVLGVTTAFMELLNKGNTRRGWPAAKLQQPDTHVRSLKGVEGVDDDDLRTSQIITISSVAAIERSALTGFAYAMSKAAITHLGHSFATVLSPWNIRSNIVEPGWYRSDITTWLPFISGTMPWGNTPAGRAGGSTDVAGFFLYLVGKSGAYVNGASIVTDGGREHRFFPEVSFQELRLK